MRSKPLKLSARQKELLSYLAQGYEWSEISDVTGLAATTVRTHLGAAYAKLGVDNRHDAVRRARELELID